jgi:hypothetical protein
MFALADAPVGRTKALETDELDWNPGSAIHTLCDLEQFI